MRKRTLMAALAALGLAAAPVTPAVAQTNTSYCEGRLQASVFYSTLTKTSTNSTTSFWVILQNTTRSDVNFAVAFGANQTNSRPNGTLFTKLGPWGTSQPVLLGRQWVNNTSGSGVLPLPELRGYTRVTCR